VGTHDFAALSRLGHWNPHAFFIAAYIFLFAESSPSYGRRPVFGPISFFFSSLSTLNQHLHGCILNCTFRLLIIQVQRMGWIRQPVNFRNNKKRTEKKRDTTPVSSAVSSAARPFHPSFPRLHLPFLTLDNWPGSPFLRGLPVSSSTVFMDHGLGPSPGHPPNKNKEGKKM
jgi:hypothetical protein